MNEGNWSRETTARWLKECVFYGRSVRDSRHLRARDSLYSVQRKQHPTFQRQQSQWEKHHLAERKQHPILSKTARSIDPSQGKTQSGLSKERKVCAANPQVVCMLTANGWSCIVPGPQALWLSTMQTLAHYLQDGMLHEQERSIIRSKQTIVHCLQDGKLHEQEKNSIWPKETMAYYIQDSRLHEQERRSCSRRKQ